MSQKEAETIRKLKHNVTKLGGQFKFQVSETLNKAKKVDTLKHSSRHMNGNL